MTRELTETLRSIRSVGIEELAATLKSAKAGATETDLRDAWAERLRVHDEFALTGWYTPPPDGIILETAPSDALQTLGKPTYRVPEAWPSADRSWERDGLLFAYCSPVHRATGLIGDTGLTLYAGPDQRVRDHIAKVWDLTIEAATSVTVGMRICDVYALTKKLIDNANLQSNVYSAHTGQTTDIGHTIPWSDESITPEERNAMSPDVVSNKRLFVNAGEMWVLPDTIAFTVEPRLGAPGLPTVGFHTVVVFENGVRTVLADFDAAFGEAGMDYLR